MIAFVQKYAANHAYSQNGEEGIIEECLLRIRNPRDDVYCVEIGANDGRFCSNTAHLIEQGAHGVFVESDNELWQKCATSWKENPRVKVIHRTVDRENINEFVNARCDVFSTDTDGADYVIFKGLKAKPKIVIIEIDSGYLPSNPVFNRDGAASYTPMVQLGIEKGYFLLCHTGNLVFVDQRYRQLFPEIIGDGLSNSELYFNTSWLAAKTREVA